MSKEMRCKGGIGVVLTLLIGATMIGCGGGGTEVRDPPAIFDLVSRVMHGEEPSVVLGEARAFGETFAAEVKVRAAAAHRAYQEFSSSEDREAACLTLDAVNAAGGVDQTPETKILEFARQRFNREAQAEQFASDLKSLTQLDLTVVPSLYCATT
jgi:hypothetical protein